MAPDNIEPVPDLTDAPPVEALEPVADEPPPADSPVEAPSAQAAPTEPPSEPSAQPTPPSAKGNFDAGLQRSQREIAELRGQITNLTTLLTQTLAQRPATPTAEQIQSATVSAAETRANDLVANLDRQITAAAPDSEAAMILKGLKDLAVLTAQQARDAREEVARVRTEATAQVQEVAQQATVWTRFDADYPHLAGKGPTEWQRILAEGKAEGKDPSNPMHKAILSDRFEQWARASKPRTTIAPLRPRPSGSAPSAVRQPGAQDPTAGMTDAQLEQWERQERDRVARKFETAINRYANEGGIESSPA